MTSPLHFIPSWMKRSTFSTCLLVLFTVGCSTPEPQPIDYGNTQCESCKMMVADPRFGAEAVSKTGKLYMFDALECMVGWYLAEEGIPMADVHSLWVSDHAKPATLINVESASFVLSEELRSPMSMNVASFALERDAHAAIKRYGGEQIDFARVKILAEDYK